MHIDTILKRVRFEGYGKCWTWLGVVTNNGYGQITIEGRKYRPHRVVMNLYHKFDLDSAELIMHVCDNKLCCNPAHLRVGTQIDNMLDCKAKGRMQYGFTPGHKINVGKHYKRKGKSHAST